MYQTTSKQAVRVREMAKPLVQMKAPDPASLESGVNISFQQHEQNNMSSKGLINELRGRLKFIRYNFIGCK